MLYGMGAGALWGLVFVAPKLAGSFSPLQLTIGRYLAYGLISALLLAPRWRKLVHRLGRREWLALAWLGLCGNTLYYLLLATAVQAGGIALTSLVIGFLPVTVTALGSRHKGAVPFAKLAPSLLLCAGGAVCIGWQALALAPAPGASHSLQLSGLACAVGALASWTIFAVSNSRWLSRLQTISAHDWSLLTGVVTGAQTLLLLPLALVFEHSRHGALAWAQFGAVCLGVAIVASIVGSALWNRMSRLLPLTLVGQMILFETLFALIYGFVWERRLPTVLETSAFTLVVFSVLSCVHAHRAPRAYAASNPTPAP
jgi:drug/metabolite transporter (DMT)-like permease